MTTRSLSTAESWLPMDRATGRSGNSMAVPVMRWVGERIASVEAILGDDPGTRRLP